MDSERRYAIRLYVQDENGRLLDEREEYELPDFCGVVPVVGDLIVNPGVLAGRDRRDVINREVWEVISRYFLPHAHGDELCYVVLGVTVRQGEDFEVDIVTR